MHTKIIIAGIGGVGGYFGGLLAKHFHAHQDVRISFFARGKHLEEIKKNGLRVIKAETEFIVRPSVASDKAADLGIADFLIVATKSYDLETVLEQLRDCINENTMILPLLNGVDSRERIRKLFPANMVLDGCTYLVSRLKEPGVVENSGNIQTIYFGLDKVTDERMRELERLLKEANIEATLSPEISTILWEKFIFISPTATATSRFDKSIGELMADKACVESVTALIEEVRQLAQAKGIAVSEDITGKTLNKLKTLPFATTSSMHSDFRNNKPVTELETLTGYVIREAQKHHVNTPSYVKAYGALQQKG